MKWYDTTTQRIMLCWWRPLSQLHTNLIVPFFASPFEPFRREKDLEWSQTERQRILRKYQFGSLSHKWWYHSLLAHQHISYTQTISFSRIIAKAKKKFNTWKKLSIPIPVSGVSSYSAQRLSESKFPVEEFIWPSRLEFM